MSDAMDEYFKISETAAARRIKDKICFAMWEYWAYLDSMGLINIGLNCNDLVAEITEWDRNAVAIYLRTSQRYDHQERVNVEPDPPLLPPVTIND